MPEVRSLGLDCVALDILLGQESACCLQSYHFSSSRDEEKIGFKASKKSKENFLAMNDGSGKGLLLKSCNLCLCTWRDRSKLFTDILRCINFPGTPGIQF